MNKENYEQNNQKNIHNFIYCGRDGNNGDRVFCQPYLYGVFGKFGAESKHHTHP